MLLIAGPLIATVPQDVKQTLLGLIRDALYDARISLEKLSVWTEVDKAQLHRALHGDGHVNFSWLMCLPTSFWSAFGRHLVLHFGFPPAVQRAWHLYEALRGTKKSMARIEPPVESERKKVG